mmetsp:Transcript_14568/g.28189  ORF Transcript_14568/g.28189 Transcript_14568/m.28189 type:complete len:359 (-) Transcript_14568:487-1563(-)|eukprot:CAMPEP_0171495408 /NCGR_PEP_ID=MMETSP0958-20121227/6131_1 /TAXON_ID=87120 /ORGANISM="Aurantiochytrium limacinum, Strain ATCCMYA-1381" /LENGTH=358 /DNA_ID=CAMNT_0012029399 /DNA_START=1154 /DNA_END=2230 /DNA_ORIENTATION=-
MTTVTNTLQGFVHHFAGTDLETLGVPPEIICNVKGIIFANRIMPGRVTHNVHGGIFSCLDEESGKWTYPVALQFLSGLVTSWSAYDRVELLVLITDPEVCQLLKSLGQIGFGDHSAHKIENGIALRSDRFLTSTYESAKKNPDFGKASYAYHMGHKVLHEAEVKDIIWQFRSSSNEKFYGTRNGSLHNIAKLHALTEEDKSDVAIKSILTRWPTRNHELADKYISVLQAMMHPIANPSGKEYAGVPYHTTSTSSAPPPPPRPSMETRDDFALGGFGGAPAEYPMPVSRSRASTWAHAGPQPTSTWGGSSSSTSSGYDSYQEQDNDSVQHKIPAPVTESPAEDEVKKVQVSRQSSFEFN